MKIVSLISLLSLFLTVNLFAASEKNLVTGMNDNDYLVIDWQTLDPGYGSDFMSDKELALVFGIMDLSSKDNRVGYFYTSDIVAVDETNKGTVRVNEKIHISAKAINDTVKKWPKEKAKDLRLLVLLVEEDLFKDDVLIARHISFDKLSADVRSFHLSQEKSSLYSKLRKPAPAQTTIRMYIKRVVCDSNQWSCPVH